MDEIRRLEQEIRALQAQLQRQNTEAARARQQLIDRNRQNLDSFQRDMHQAIQAHDREAEAEYERLLREYQNSINADVQLELAKMDAEYSRLLSEVKRNEAILLQKNQELEEAIEAIRKDYSRRNAGSSQEAKNYLMNATSFFHTIEERPHEKFTPKRLQIYFNAIRDGQQLFRAGLYEAASAVAISARSGLERLGYTIDEKLDDWEKNFDLFSRKTAYLIEKIEQAINDCANLSAIEHQNETNVRKRILVELNFWCRGEFWNITQLAKKAQKTVGDYRKSGEDIYLKQADSPSVDDLKKSIEEIDGAIHRLSELSPLYQARYTASCERSDWGERIIDFLTTEINLDWLENDTGFRVVPVDVQDAKDFADYIQYQTDAGFESQDVREWLRIVFQNSSSTRIFVYIVPVESKSSVENHIILFVDFTGAEQEQYSRDLFTHICEAVNLEYDTGIVNYASDVDALKIHSNTAYKETGKDIEKSLRQRRS